LVEPRRTIDLERNTLRLLCAECLAAERRNALCRRLQPEVFLDHLHRVIFEEICALHATDAHRLRELLAARITNRGFPDADLETFLSEETVPTETLGEWLRCAESLSANRR
jgi:replicative DNA helicase